MTFTLPGPRFSARVQVRPSLMATAVVLSALAMACRNQQTSQPAQSSVEQNAKPQDDQTQNDAAARDLEAKAARFAPVNLTADISKLPDNEKQALKRLVEASKI